MALIAVIDLGEVSAGQIVDDTPAGPWPHRRWALAALVSGLALATVGGSAPAPRPLPMAVLDAPGASQVRAVDDRLFVTDPSGGAGGRADNRTIAAYRLMDLKPLWRVDLPIGGEVVGLVAAGEALVLTGDPQAGPDGRGVPEPPDIVGLDVATGALRWRSRGFVEAVTPGGRLVVSSAYQVSAAPAGEPPGAPARTLRAVATDTGKTVWSYDLPAGVMLSYRYDDRARSPRAALVAPTGRVELRDLESGQVLRSGGIGPLPAAGTDGPYVELLNDLLLVRRAASVDAYGLERFDLRWRMPADDGWFADCGTVLCFHRREQGELAVVDPQTGRVRWSGSSWGNALGTGDHLLVTEGEPAAGDRLRVAVADPDTGRVRRDLGGWDALDWNTHPRHSVLGFRFNLTDAVVARLDPERGPQILGVLHDVGRECRTQGRLLLCRRSDNKVAVWRLPA